MRFVQRAFICLSLIHAFCFSVSASSDPQENLFKKWHEATKASSTEYEKFKSDHFLIDVAEDFWVDAQKNYTPHQYLSKDVDVSLYQARSQFSREPYKLGVWVPSVIQYLQNAFNQPASAAHQLPFALSLIGNPLLLALILVLSFRLWIWSPATGYSPSITFGVIAALLGFGLFSGMWLFTAHFFLCLSIIYTRQLRPAQIGAVVTAIAIMLAPFIDVLQKAGSDLAALEALSLGRTRIAYSASSIEVLSPEQRATWNIYNGDVDLARETIAKSQTKEAAIILANLNALRITTPQIVKSYEELAVKYPNDPLIQYNLAQLYVRSQELVKADQARLKIPKNDYDEIQYFAILIGKSLLEPIFLIQFDDFLKSFQTRANEKFQELGLSPFVNQRGTKTLVYFFFPWLLLLFCLHRRKSASGLCKQTGAVTPSPTIEFSVLYQSYKQKGDATTMINVRQQADQMIRAYQQKQRGRYELTKYFLPQLSELLYEDQWVGSFLQLSFVLFLGWIAMPLQIRNELLSDFEFRWASIEFSLPFVVLFFISWIYFFVANQRRAVS